MTNSKLREGVSRLANRAVQDSDGLEVILARRILLLETAIEEHCAAAPKKADLSHFSGIGIVAPRVEWGGARTGSAKLTTLAAGGWSIF